MEDFKRSIKLGTQHSGNGGFLPVCVEIQLTGGRLSITGNIGQGHWGQIQDSLTGPYGNWSKMAPGWTYKRICQLQRAWRRWHLNDIRSGTPNQEYVLRQVRDHIDSYPDHYGVCVNILEQVGLYRDEQFTHQGEPIDPEEYASALKYRNRLRLLNEDFVWGYKYGSRWIREEVPEEVLVWLKECPRSGDLGQWDEGSRPSDFVPNGTAPRSSGFMTALSVGVSPEGSSPPDSIT